MIKKFLHKIYVFIGITINCFRLCYWCMRDIIIKPKQKSVLFVAHPDDDTLFFHTFIKKEKPYVVLLTTAWSLRRYPCFKKVMKYYGVKYRAYSFGTNDVRTKLLEKRVSKVLRRIDPEICATHNSEGEYGHEMHKRVHECVKNLAKCKVITPISDAFIENYPISDKEIKEKTMIFNSFYTTEKFVLNEYSKWVINEKLCQDD